MEKKIGLLKLGGINVKIVEDDVTCELVDCIVVPEFNNCASYGGVGGACARRGLGKGLEVYDKRAQQKPFAYGDALLTESGRDKLFLGHVVTVGVPAEEQFAAVFKSVYKIVCDCNQRPYATIRRIAVPELGTGIIGSLTQEQSARAIIGAIDAFSRVCGATIVKEVVLCAYKTSTKPAEKVLSDDSFRDCKFEVGQKIFDPVAWLHGMGLEFSKA